MGNKQLIDKNGQYLLDKKSSGSGHIFWAIGVEYNNNLNLDLEVMTKFDFEFGVGGSWYSLIQIEDLRDTNGWYHIVFSYDSSITATDKFKNLY